MEGGGGEESKVAETSPILISDPVNQNKDTQNKIKVSRTEKIGSSNGKEGSQLGIVWESSRVYVKCHGQMK